MCGIYGVLGNVDAGVKKLLAVMNVERGNDACGFWNGISRVRIPKSIVDALGDGNIQSNIWNTDIFLGHNRNASAGLGMGRQSTKANTHPFRFRDTVGAHNGFINNWMKLLREEFPGELQRVNVDSEVAIIAIDKFGSEAFGKLEGRGAIWYTNIKNRNLIYVWICDQVFHIHIDKDLIVFSSDGRHLKACGFKKFDKMKDDGQLIQIDITDMSVKKVGTFPAHREVIITRPSWPEREEAIYRPERHFDRVAREWFEINGNCVSLFMRYDAKAPYKQYVHNDHKVEEYRRKIRDINGYDDRQQRLPMKIDPKTVTDSGSSGTRVQERTINLIEIIMSEEEHYWCPDCKDFVLESDFVHIEQGEEVSSFVTDAEENICCPRCHKLCTKPDNLHDYKNLRAYCDLVSMFGSDDQKKRLKNIYDFFGEDINNIRVCETCDGAGRIRTNNTCKACNGTKLNSMNSECGICSGSGTVESTERCPTCRGKQLIKVIRVKPAEPSEEEVAGLVDGD